MTNTSSEMIGDLYRTRRLVPRVEVAYVTYGKLSQQLTMRFF